MVNVMPLPISAGMPRLEPHKVHHTNVTLMIGDAKQFRNLTHNFPLSSGVFCLEFKALSEGFFNSLQPGTVVSPAISAQFDCLDIARLLDRVSYTGAFRVVCDNLPNPDMIRQEVNRQFPHLDFGIVTENRLTA